MNLVIDFLETILLRLDVHISVDLCRGHQDDYEPIKEPAEQMDKEGYDN